MGAVVSLFGVSATFDGGVWTCRANADLAADLNATIPEKRPSDPHYSSTVAKAAAAKLGAKVLHVDPVSPPFDPSRVY